MEGIKTKIKIQYKKSNLIHSNKINLNLNSQNILLNFKNITDLDFNFNIHELYNELTLFCYKNTKEFIILLDEIFISLKTKIENLLLNINSQNDEEFLNNFINNYKKSENILNITKSFIINNKTRFEPNLILKMNNFNAKNLILEILKNSGKFIIEKIKKYVRSNENLKNNNFILTIINFLHTVGERELFNEIEQIESENIINYYKQISNEETITDDNLASYLDNFNKKIQSEIFNYKILFNEKNANLLNEKLIDVVFIDKLANILQNKSIMESLFINKNYTILNSIYKIMNRKSENLIHFQENFFEFYINKFNQEMKIPTNIKEGLIYIDFLLDRVKILNDIFNISFNKDRRIQLRYKEALFRLINNKNIKIMSTLCGIYLNEIMSRNNQNHNLCIDLLTNFVQILQGVDDVDLFFNMTSKFLVKRISILKYSQKNEIFMIKLLKENFGVRYCFSLYRILEDLKQSEMFYNKIFNDGKNNLNLFSFNAINQNDLITVINKLVSPFNEINNLINTEYHEMFQHRNIYISQNLSTCLLKFKNYDLLTNYIQANILLLFNKKEKILLNNIMDILEVKNVPNFRLNLLSMIHFGIINIANKSNIAENELLNTDELFINKNFEKTTQAIINLTNITDLSKKSLDVLQLSKENTSQSDINSMENSMESQKAIYTANKIYIHDSKIIQLIKHSSNKRIDHNTLVKNFISLTKHLFAPDVSLVTKRLENLIERNLIKKILEIENNKIIYEYN